MLAPDSLSTRNAGGESEIIGLQVELGGDLARPRLDILDLEGIAPKRVNDPRIAKKSSFSEPISPLTTVTDCSATDR
jgi:hypothetical protein